MGQESIIDVFMFKSFIFPFKQHIWTFLVSYALWVENEAFKHENGCKDLIRLKNGKETFQSLLMFKIFVYISNSRCGGLLSDDNIYRNSSHLGIRSSLNQWILVYIGFFNCTLCIYLHIYNRSHAPKHVPVCWLNWRFNHQSLPKKPNENALFIFFIILWNNISMAKGSWSNLKDRKYNSFYHISKTGRLLLTLEYKLVT